jgi:hypothetical protein
MYQYKFLCQTGIALTFVLLVSAGQAQYQLTSSTFSNGGIQMSSPVFTVSSTVGQTAVGQSQNNSNLLLSGFWYTKQLLVGIPSEDPTLPREFQLLQNYPNPFNPMTNIKYAVPKQSQVRIEIYNILGQRVRTLLNEEKPPGYYVVEFDASNLASGFYIYRMQAEGFEDIRKMIVTK